MLSTSAQKSPNQPAPDFQWDANSFTKLDFTRTLATAKDLIPAEKAALVKAISTQIRPFKADLEIKSEHELRTIALSSRFKFIDLNEDGVPEIIVQPVGMKTGCGATGNCPFWVFVKTPEGYKELMDTRGKDGLGGIELYRVETTVTNNFHNITVASHDSASEKTVLVYTFQSGIYRPIRCYGLSWTSTDGGRWHELKNPTVTRCEVR